MRLRNWKGDGKLGISNVSSSCISSHAYSTLRNLSFAVPFTFDNFPLPTLSVIADGLVKIGLGLGIGYAGLFGAVYLATFLISNIVTNNAAAGKSKLMQQMFLLSTGITRCSPLLFLAPNSIDVPYCHGGCGNDRSR